MLIVPVLHSGDSRALWSREGRSHQRRLWGESRRKDDNRMEEGRRQRQDKVVRRALSVR